MFQCVGNNVYVGIELIGFILSLVCFLINVILIRLIEYRFVIYVKEHHRELWQKYTDYSPRVWGRFLYFVRPLENSEDGTIKKLCMSVLHYEKFAKIAILLLIVFFVSMIATAISMQ